ncbi:MAG TPA: hypothetical protein VN620_08100 [Candidatus Methylomirabilis sp.]|nr:hypothetical protein [Candidatus Methylomirabilis sp.]
MTGSKGGKLWTAICSVRGVLGCKYSVVGGFADEPGLPSIYVVNTVRSSPCSHDVNRYPIVDAPGLTMVLQNNSDFFPNWDF